MGNGPQLPMLGAKWLLLLPLLFTGVLGVRLRSRFPKSVSVSEVGVVDIAIPGLGALQGINLDVPGAVDLVAFLSVPYAEPPVGNLRWRPPSPFPAWSGILDATRWAPICPQFPSLLDEMYLSNATQSEDCLYLQIYMPFAALGSVEPLPVMIYLPGGGYVTDTPAVYPGEYLVMSSKGAVIVVEVAYRLSVFGFLTSSEILERDPGAVSLGLQDQQLAMQWVKDNIAAFGGDPKRVTIFGQSSGAASVMYHLVHNASYGLYSGAILQSGMFSQAVQTMDQAAATYNAVLSATRCRKLRCLLTVGTTELLAAAVTVGDQGFLPVVDNVTLKGKPWDLIQQGNYNNKVPILLGSCRDEIAFFMIERPTWPKNMSQDEFASLMLQLWSFSEENTTRIMKAYSEESGYSYPADLGGYTSYWWTLMRMRTDDNFGHCAERWIAQNLEKGGTPNIFLYVFGANLVPDPFVMHSDDLYYLFSYEGKLGPMHRVLTRYWTNFAKTGTPNAPWKDGPPAWPLYSKKRDQAMYIYGNTDVATQTAEILTDYRHDACEFWDTWHNDHGFTAQTVPNVTLSQNVVWSRSISQKPKSKKRLRTQTTAEPKVGQVRHSVREKRPTPEQHKGRGRRKA